LAPESVAVVQVEPGPKFVGIERLAPGGIRLQLMGPTGLVQVLERSADLQEWQPWLTNTPAASPYELVTDWRPHDTAALFRLRW
jgi:hypothetical protein